jgi:hypothetical protein
VNRSPQQQAQQAQADFRADLRNGTVSVIADRFGTPLTVGDMVIAAITPDPVYQIQQVTPVMDPNIQPGTLRVKLATEVEVLMAGGRPIPTLVRVGRVSEPAPAEAPADPPPLMETDAAPSVVDPEPAPAPVAE